MRGLEKRFGDRCLFAGLDLDFAVGRTTVITGRSGAGKSTLLRILNQLERHDAGVVRSDGLEIPAGLPHGEWKRRAARLRRRTGMVFQGYQLFPHLSVLANVTLAPIRGKRVPAADARAQALQLLESVGMAAVADRYPARLSGGESQRVAIARALAMEPEVLLLDEPTSALDPASARDVVGVIQRLRARGFTQVLVTHQHELAQQLADQLVDLDR
ncbi:MAG TPA: ATP-binding cassette domain-containing protein [Planctomycetota bacterium]|nr:ATP-binding cassette domain-containing protein [Planctomycetota bacterium]